MDHGNHNLPSPMKLHCLLVLLILYVPTVFGAKAVMTYRNREYDVVAAKNENVIIRTNDRTKTLKAEGIRFVDDAINRLPDTTLELESLLVTLRSKGTRALIIEADIEASTNLNDCFLILISGSGNDVNTVVRTLPELPARQSSRVSFTIKTDKFTKMEPYQLCFFSDGQSIVMSDGSDIVKNRITPYEQMPRALFQVDSVFPESLISQYSQATVVMEFTIGDDGSAINPKALDSPHPLFTKSAMDYLQNSRFAPRYSKGVPKPSRIKQAIVFRNQKPAAEDAQ